MDNFSIASLDVKEVFETSSVEESNEFLKKGWTILHIYTKDDCAIYVMGLPGITKTLEDIKNFDPDEK